MSRCVHVFISGRVQGVFFRVHTKKKADELGIFGWVRNTSDGRVEAVFEGEKDEIEKMIDWCYEGSPYSQVKNIDIKWETFDKTQGRKDGRLAGFEVRE